MLHLEDQKEEEEDERKEKKKILTFSKKTPFSNCKVFHKISMIWNLILFLPQMKKFHIPISISISTHKTIKNIAFKAIKPSWLVQQLAEINPLL